MKMFDKVLSVAALSMVTALFAATPASAFPVQSPVKTIRNDHGGYVIDYAIRMNELKRSKTAVKFAGRCDSACTILLALPKSKTCITPQVRFGFHLPFGAGARGNIVAANYMLKTYPAWVKSWINAQGGLSNSLKVMSYSYASQHLPTCGGSMQTATRSTNGAIKRAVVQRGPAPFF